MRRLKASAAHLLICAVITACHGGSESDSSTTAEAPKDAIAKTAEHGPVKVVTKVWPAKPTLSDSIYLRLEIASPPGVRINAPFQEAGDQRLGRFRIVGFTRDGAGTHEVQTYTLEAPASGKQRIPPMRIEMIDGRPGRGGSAGNDGSASGGGSSSAGSGDGINAGSSGGSGSGVADVGGGTAGGTGSGVVGASSVASGGPSSGGNSGASGAQEVLTEEVALDIAPVSAEQLSAKTMHGAAGTLDPNVGGLPWMAILLIVSAIAVVGSGTVLALRARATRRKIAARRTAYEEAVARLAQLEQRGAPEPASADAWFVDLSDIVRNYLEHRYEIRAPELTTEEFLVVASQATAMSAEHRALLSAFLVRCDRVKFAGYRPDSEESLASLKAARAFVEDTRASQVVSP